MNKTFRNALIATAAIAACTFGTKAEASSVCHSWTQRAVDAVAQGYTKREILRGPAKAWANAGCYDDGQFANIMWAADMAEIENGI